MLLDSTKISDATPLSELTGSPSVTNVVKLLTVLATRLSTECLLCWVNGAGIFRLNTHRRAHREHRGSDRLTSVAICQLRPRTLLWDSCISYPAKAAPPFLIADHGFGERAVFLTKRCASNIGTG